MRISCDTNIVLRLAQPHHPMHPDARDSTRVLMQAGHELCLFQQNLFEFWAVATRPKKENGLGWDIPQAEAELARIENEFTILPDSPLTYPGWRRLVVLHQVRGKPTHDARLVAAMHVHAVTHLLTFNDADFRRYPTISVLTPAGVVAGSHP